MVSVALGRPRVWISLGVALGVVVAGLTGLRGGPVRAATDRAAYAWVQVEPGGAAEVRAIVDGAGCPDLVADDWSAPMAARGRPTAEFPVQVCEAPVPAGASRLEVLGHELPPLNRAPGRIAVLGDTGCRLKHHEFQACNDPAAWPFARVATAAAEVRPDLIVHVGDYIYREAECPPGNAGCAGSPAATLDRPGTYTWEVWEADFFRPAGPLLSAALWIFTRGDHETCQRAADGYLLFFAPGPLAAGWPEACPAVLPAYDAGLDPESGLQLLMLDSSSADDTKPDQVAAYAEEFAALEALIDRGRDGPAPPAWLVTHRPVWGIWPETSAHGELKIEILNRTLQAALDRHNGGVWPGPTLSGHIHVIEWLRFAGGRWPAIVAGNGGTELLPAGLTDPAGLAIEGVVVTGGRIAYRFGFLTLERSGSGPGARWIGVARDETGQGWQTFRPDDRAAK